MSTIGEPFGRSRLPGGTCSRRRFKSGPAGPTYYELFGMYSSRSARGIHLAERDEYDWQTIPDDSATKRAETPQRTSGLRRIFTLVRQLREQPDAGKGPVAFGRRQGDVQRLGCF